MQPDDNAIRAAGPPSRQRRLFAGDAGAARRIVAWLVAPGGYAVALLVLGAAGLLSSWRVPGESPAAFAMPTHLAGDGACLLLAGLGLLLGQPPQRWRLLGMRACGWLLLVCALLPATGGRFVSSPSQPYQDGSLATLAMLAFAGTGLYFLGARSGPRRLLGSGGLLLVAAVSLVDLLGWASGVYDQLDAWHPGGPARPELWLLMAGLVAHGASAGGGRLLFRRRADRRICLLGGLILIVITTAIGAFVLSCSARYLVAMQELAQVDRARHLAEDFRRVVREAALLLARQGNAARALYAQRPPPAGGGAVFDRLRTATEGRLSGLYWSIDGQLQPLVGAALPARFAFDIPWREGVAGRLVWADGLKLMVEHPAGGGRNLLMVADIDAEYFQYLAAAAVQEQGSLLLCAAGTRPGALACLPRHPAEVPATEGAGLAAPQLQALLAALGGKTGFMNAVGRRGLRESLAHVPVTAELGLVVRQEGNPALALVWRQAWLAAPLILGLSLLGILLFQRVALGVVRGLLQRQAYARALFELMPVALVLVDEEGRVTDMNPPAERLFACSRHEFEGMPAARLFPGRELQDARGGFRTSWGMLRPVRARRCDGDAFDARVGVARYACAGRRCSVLLVRDVTRALRRERELDYWEQIFVHAEWGVVVLGGDGLSQERMNARFAAMHGYSEEDLRGLPFTYVAAPAMRTPLAAHLALAQSRGRHTFESLHVRRDGREFPVSISVTTVREANGSVRCRVVHVRDISERKRLELALRNAENAQRTMLDSQRDLIFRWRPDFTLEYANLTFAAVFGRLPGEVLGKNWLELMPAAMRQQVEAQLAELVRRPRHLEYEARLTLDCGTSAWFVWSHSPLYNREGLLIGFQGWAYDITASKEAELLVAESQGLMRSLFDGRSQPICLLAADGTVTRANRALLALAGSDGHEDLTRFELWRGPWCRGMPHAADRLRSAVACAARGVTDRLEAVVPGDAGQGRVFEIILAPVCDPPGEGVKAILAEWHDVTQARRMEQMAAEREARLRAMAASLAGMVFEFRVDREELRPSYVSEGAERLCGIRAEELLSGARRLVDCVHDEDREGFAASLARSAQLSADWNWTGRLSGTRRGEPTWVNIRARPRAIGRQVIWDAVALDITELKQKELEIADSRQALRELSAHREAVREDERKYIAREIHDELGQNLTAVRMGLAVLAERCTMLPAAAELREDIARLKDLADKSIGVVRSVATSLRPAALDMGLAAALTWLADEFQGRHGIACTLDLSGAPGGLPDEMATGLFRIVQESLTNVSRHAGAHKVHVMLRQLGNHVVLEVRDDGVGFEDDGGRKGYGLMGMRERTLMLGGRINIVGKSGQGTMISVSVPLRPPTRER